MSRKSVRAIESEALDQVPSIVTGIRNAQWPYQFTKHIIDYEAAGWGRDRFLWKWVWVLLRAEGPGFTLSCVPSENRDLVAHMKTNLAMAVTIADDAADLMQDEDLVKRVVKLPLERDCMDVKEDTSCPTMALLGRLLDETVDTLRAQPNWEALRDVFFYDLKQVWNAFDHAYLTNKHPEVINYEESCAYGAHNMMFFLFATVDLICSPEFDFHDLPRLRSVLYKAQRMARIGNWVSTWEREIVVGDLTSGLVSILIGRGMVPFDKMWQMSNAEDAGEVIQIAREALLEDELLDEWEDLRSQILTHDSPMESIDLNAYVDGLELVMCYHFASKGLK